ncbi:MAG: hypothetical protein GY857_14335 [Desulfobacula sp.]|nr:hypothetical protein [Desulfobacula sp.]
MKESPYEMVGSKTETQVMKEKYEAPTFESHLPLEIMSQWCDNSSDIKVGGLLQTSFYKRKGRGLRPCLCI